MTLSTPPAIADLFRRYLSEQTDAQVAGLGFAAPIGDVQPHDPAGSQPIDPRQAWDEARAVLSHFSELPKAEWRVPPEWPTLIGSAVPTAALAFCLGNSPQLVREVQPLLSGDLATLRPAGSRSANLASACEWATPGLDTPRALLAAAVLRLAGEFDRAAEVLESQPPSAWQAVHANERAALAWHSGRHEEAARLWREQPDSVAVHFNRGMAALFLDDPATARTSLDAAIGALAESSSWHHLARLYRTLAERG